MRFENKIAVVTGGTRGLGRAISERLLAEGAAVVATYAANEEAAESFRSAHADGKRPPQVIRCDVSVRSEVAELFQSVQARWDRVDLLINNAGVFLRTALGETREEDLDRLWDVNVKGTFLCIEAAVPLMPEGGRIINLSSTAARAAQMVDYSMYGATKAAVEALTRRLAAELAPKRILVNAVAPGLVLTEMGLEVVRATGGDRDTVGRRFPLGRAGEPEDIADVVAFLCSEDGRWINGQSLNVSGGQVW
jgi:3-oxoacyl-[acyl-carrier protein] reductase